MNEEEAHRVRHSGMESAGRGSQPSASMLLSSRAVRLLISVVLSLVLWVAQGSDGPSP